VRREIFSRQGHEDLLQAAAAVRADHPQVRFLIVGEATAGEDAYARQIRALAESLQLGDGAIFAGFRRDVPDVMASCDIFAFPSHAESFGVVLIEAMAMELPVVSTNCDGVLDIVVDGKTGLEVPRTIQLRWRRRSRGSRLTRRCVDGSEEQGGRECWNFLRGNDRWTVWRESTGKCCMNDRPEN